MADVRDVVGRIMAQLALQDGKHVIDTNEAVIIVAPEVLPSQAMTFDRMRVAGIITEAGGATGHAAILARSLGIPAVTGLRGILREVRTGDLIALDGREGHVYLNPGPEVEAAYRKLQREYVALCDSLIENRDPEPVTIRTLDLGGDKQVPYFGHQREANPFMGWRSIRLSTAYPDFFRTQLRAILRASRFGQVSLLFPMVSTLEEVHRLKRMVQRTRRELQREGEGFDRDIPLGVMLE